MELFPLLPNLIAILAIITGVSFGGWLMAGFFGVRDRGEHAELPEADLPGHLHETLSIPPVLVLFFWFVGIFMVGYVLYIWLGGVTY